MKEIEEIKIFIQFINTKIKNEFKICKNLKNLEK